MTALWPADFWGSSRSFMASNTWVRMVSTPAAVANSLISSSDRPSSSWARASGLFASLIWSLITRNTTDHAERLLRGLRPAGLHRVRTVAGRGSDPARRMVQEPRAPPPGVRRLAPLRHPGAHGPALVGRPDRHRPV